MPARLALTVSQPPSSARWRLRLVLRESLLLVWGVVNRQEGTVKIVVQQA